jgi:hypothetical protein
VTENLAYRFDGFVPSATQAFDNRNHVFWMFSGWPYDPTLLAVTFRYFDRSDGRLLDADIVFNGQRYGWAVGGHGRGYDIENSAAHEVGHFSGLGHSTDPEATMYGSARAGETKKRSLAGDDVAGLAAVYGSAPVESAGGGVVSNSSCGVGGGGGGGCSIARDGARGIAPDLAWTGIALSLLALRRRRASRCLAPARLTRSADGTPRIDARSRRVADEPPGSMNEPAGARLPVALDRGGRVLDERRPREALRRPGVRDCVLGPGV